MLIPELKITILVFSDCIKLLFLWWNFGGAIWIGHQQGRLPSLSCQVSQAYLILHVHNWWDFLVIIEWFKVAKIARFETVFFITHFKVFDQASLNPHFILNSTMNFAMVILIWYFIKYNVLASTQCLFIFNSWWIIPDMDTQK